MATALEKYYHRKGKPEKILQEKSASELLGRQMLKKHSPGFFVKLLDILDRPGNATRALLVGKLGGLKGLIPFAQVIEDLTGINIALDPEERVAGTEVIEKFFGKQKQVKGKIDMVDVLGLLVEIVADPLWLLGGAGLTKLGKAQKIAGGQMKAAKEMAAAIKAGKAVSPTASKNFVRAVKTIIEAGQQPGLARSWAEQAAKGQRAALKLGLPGKRIPVITGSPAFWNKLDDFATWWKKSAIGGKFFPATRQVHSRYSKLHEMFTDYARNIPERESAEAMERFSIFQKNLIKMFGADKLDEADALMAKFVESEFADAPRKIAKIKAERLQRLRPGITQYSREVKALEKRIATQQRELAKLRGPKPLKPIPKKPTKPGAIAVVAKPKPVLTSATRHGSIIYMQFDSTAPIPSVEDLKKFLSLPDASISVGRKAPGFVSTIQGGTNFEINVSKLSGPNSSDLAQKVFNAKIGPGNTYKGKTVLEQALPLKERFTKVARAAVEAETGAPKPVKPKGKAVPAKKLGVPVARKARPLTIGKRLGAIKEMKGRKAILERKVAKKFKLAGREDIKAIREAKARGIFHKAEAARLLGEVPEKARPEFLKAARELGPEYSAELLKAERRAGLKVGALDETIGYLSRAGALTEDARRFMSDTKLQERFLVRAKKIRPRHAAQKGRGVLGELTRDEIDRIFKNMGFKGEHVFDPSFARAQFARTAMSARARGSARFFHEAVNEFADDASKVGVGYPASEIMDKTGLLYNKAALQGKFLPKEVAQAMTSMHDLLIRPEQLGNAYTGVTRYLKGAFTLPFPAYHMRNHFSNYVLNWIGGVKNPKSYLMSIQLQRAAAATMKRARSLNIPFDEAARQVRWPSVQTATGMVDGSAFWQLMDRHGILHKSPGMMDIIEVPGATGLQQLAPTRLGRHVRGQSRGWQALRNIGLAVEDHARIAHFVEKSATGMNPGTAARSVKRVLFDYGDLSDFEKRIFRDKLFFFYTFARKNIGLQAETLLTQPAKQAVFAHLAGGTPVMQGQARNYPDWWNERLTIPTPFRDREGRQQVVTGTGLPIEEAFGPLGGPGVGLINQGRRMLSRGMSRLNPIPLKIIEASTGHQMYFDKPITDYGRWAEQSLPTGRLTGTIRHAVESTDSPGSKALGIATGIRYRPLEPLKQAEYHEKAVAREFLKGKAPVFKRYFKPKGTEVSTKIDLALQMQR